MPKRTHKNFTLVELMVAMAILVIMMGFLFQFVISAQRLWSASSQNASLFEQSQIVLSTFEADLQNAIVHDDSGPSIPYYRTVGGTNEPHFPNGSHHNIVATFFLTQSGDFPSTDANRGIGACPILYIFRRTGSSSTTTSSARYKLYRIPLPSFFNYVEAGPEAISDEITTQMSNLDSHPEYIICENVLDCNIQFLNHPNESRPQVARFTLTLFDPAQIPQIPNCLERLSNPSEYEVGTYHNDRDPSNPHYSANWETDLLQPASHRFVKLITLP